MSDLKARCGCVPEECGTARCPLDHRMFQDSMVHVNDSRCMIHAQAAEISRLRGEVERLEALCSQFDFADETQTDLSRHKKLVERLRVAERTSFGLYGDELARNVLREFDKEA